MQIGLKAVAFKIKEYVNLKKNLASVSPVVIPEQSGCLFKLGLPSDYLKQ